jgi:hypothetical protein
MLIVFRVSLGLHILSPGHPHPPSAHCGAWSANAAILVIAIGLYIHLAAPRGTLAWLTAAVGLALVGQKVGAVFLSTTHAGSIAAIFSIALGTFIGWSVFNPVSTAHLMRSGGRPGPFIRSRPWPCPEDRRPGSDPNELR